MTTETWSGGGRPVAALVLAAGMGTRMKSALPKVLHPVAGAPMVLHVLAALKDAGVERLGVVVAPGAEAVSTVLGPVPSYVQAVPRGTADAVRAGMALLDGFEGDVVVAFGDTPLVRPQTFLALVAALRGPSDPAIAVAAMRPADPARYGRLVLAADGMLDRIVEFAEASEADRTIGLCNGGIMAFDARRLAPLLGEIEPSRQKGEYYLTDAVAIARARGWSVVHAEIAEEEVLGVDTRSKLAEAEAVMQERLRATAMDGGATLVDPATVWLSFDTRLGRDVFVGPSTWFGPGVTVEDDVEIKGFCHIEGAVIRSGARIGPFARLRPGTEVGRDAHVGNFVELKAAKMGEGAKANHLTYLGDVDVGAKANIGAGTITCNYDGFFKHRTIIGREAFIGSNTALVAPVSIGAGATTGAGSVITRDVAEGALAVERSKQSEIAGWSDRFRARKRAEKASITVGPT